MPAQVHEQVTGRRRGEHFVGQLFDGQSDVVCIHRLFASISGIEHRILQHVRCVPVREFQQLVQHTGLIILHSHVLQNGSNDLSIFRGDFPRSGSDSSRPHRRRRRRRRHRCSGSGRRLARPSCSLSLIVAAHVVARAHPAGGRKWLTLWRHAHVSSLVTGRTTGPTSSGRNGRG